MDQPRPSQFISGRAMLDALGVQAGLLDDLRRGLLVARRELKDSLTDWRIMTPVILLTFLFPWVVIYAVRFGISMAERNYPEGVLEQLIPFATMVVGFFPISFSLVIALESFVGEKERNTLESLLSTPISDGALYIGKLLAALALPLMGSVTAIALFSLALPAIAGQQVPLELMAQILLLTFTLALGMVAGAVVVSSNTTSVRAANLLSSFILIPAMLMIQLQALVIIWELPQALWFIALGQALADVLLIRMGIRVFNREELLSRTLDRIELLRAWRTLWSFVRQEPLAAIARRPSARLTLWRLYGRDIPQILRRNLGSLLVTLLVIVGAFGIGWGYAQTIVLPPQIVEKIDLNPDTLRRGLAELPQVLNISPLQVLGNNLGWQVVADLAGLISFGAAALIPLFNTAAVLGFIFGQLGKLGFDVGPVLAMLWPHGILEVPAVMLAAAAGLRMGASVLAPPRGFTLGETLLQGLADLIKLLLLVVIPLLAVAAVVEIYVTPRIALAILGG